MLVSSIVASLAAFAGVVKAVNPGDVRGQNFVDTVTNKRLYIIGIDYQPGGQSAYNPDKKADALSNGDICLRDAAILQKLGVNTIRVYNLDPAANHDACASIFNAAGIYMILDVNSPFDSLNREEPWTTYYSGYLQRIFGIVEGFKEYPNTLGFFAANEVINDLKSAKYNPRYIRAVQRDLRSYIAKHSKRHIPVGYSAADIREILDDQANYFSCAINSTDDVSRSEFFGLNAYSWCGPEATFQSSGYDVLVGLFKNITIPAFFSEYGCNKPQPRVFNEVGALYGPQMTVLSGGLIYEYSQEESDYGLVNVYGNGTVQLRIDYDNLQKQYNKLDIGLIQSANSVATGLKAPMCAKGMFSGTFDADFSLPDVPPGGADLINKGIPNPNVGKLIDIKDFNVKQEVFSSSWAPIKNLAVKPMANGESNTPSGQDTSGGGGNSSSKKNAASKTGANDAFGLISMVILGLTGVLTCLSL